MKINKAKFYKHYQTLFGKLNGHQIDALDFLLDSFEQEVKKPNVSFIGYALATVHHETNRSYYPVEEGYYLGDAAKVKRFQKTLRYYPYFGRGYCQLTWLTGYQKASKKLGIDLVNQPELALRRDVAFKIMTRGMLEGWFTGKKLGDFVDKSTGKFDHYNARTIINGHDKAKQIADYAIDFEDILNESIEPAANPAPKPDSTPAKLPEAPGDGVGRPTAIDEDWNDDGEDHAAFVDAKTDDDKTVSVPQVSAEREPDKQPGGIQAYIIAATTFITAIGAFVKENDEKIIYLIVAVGVIWFVARYLYKAHTENLNNRAREAREQRAHELQILLAQSAMHKQFNTVVIQPTPLKNSESDQQTAQTI